MVQHSQHFSSTETSNRNKESRDELNVAICHLPILQLISELFDSICLDRSQICNDLYTEHQTVARNAWTPWRNAYKRLKSWPQLQKRIVTEGASREISGRKTRCAEDFEHLGCSPHLGSFKSKSTEEKQQIKQQMICKKSMILTSHESLIIYLPMDWGFLWILGTVRPWPLCQDGCGPQWGWGRCSGGDTAQGLGGGSRRGSCTDGAHRDGCHAKGKGGALLHPNSIYPCSWWIWGCDGSGMIWSLDGFK